MVEQLVPSTCPFCGVGCGIGLRTDGRRVRGVWPIRNHPVSQGRLCAKGWSTPHGIAPEGRVLRPLIREHGGHREASWDEALSLVAEGLRDVRERLGPDACGVISCARATNEDNYAAQKLARAVLGTNNVDHCARICHSPSVAGLRQTLGSGAMTNSVADIERADLVVIFGCDPTENHSVLGGRIMRAHARGQKLLVVDPRQTRLARMADLHLQLRLGSNVALINGLLHVMFEEGWVNRAFLQARVDNVDALERKVKQYDPARVAAISGVPQEQLRAAARMYSEAQAAMLCYGMGVTQYASGTNNVIAVSNLVLAAGHIGRPGTGINPLRGQNNVQGACDMGALPNVYPGYQNVDDPAAREKFSAAWGRSVPEQPGMTSLGMTQAARAGSFGAMIILGEDPVLTDPDQNRVEQALKALDLLVVVELNMTETARLADVVLPAASFAEKDGTFTNCERRVQRVRAAIPPPGEARADFRILGAIARRLGYSGMDWERAEQVFEELRALTPIYSAMDYGALDRAQGLQWPCDPSHPDGTPYLHAVSFPIGRARMLPVDAVDPAEQPDADYPLWLTTHRVHYHYGCGSMTRRAPLLERETPEGVLFIHPDDAAALGVSRGSGVRIRSRRGEVQTRAVLSDQVPAGTVGMPYHFKEAPSNQLTNDAQDPVTKMPELKACAVRVELLPAGERPRSRDELRELQP